MNKFKTAVMLLASTINLVFKLSFIYLIAFIAWVLTSGLDNKILYEAMITKPTVGFLLVGLLASFVFFLTNLNRFLKIHTVLFKYKCLSISRLIMDAIAVASIVVAPIFLLKHQLIISQTFNPTLVLLLMAGFTYVLAKRNFCIKAMSARMGD